MTEWRIGVDIGGTFTDITLTSDDGRGILWKEDTTPGEWERAIERGLTAVAATLGHSLEGLLSDVSLFVHGSTIATNAIIQRSGARVGLVCTHGFRDSLYFRDGFKWDRFDLRTPRPHDLVDRYLRVGVVERVDSRGEIRIPLDESSVRVAADVFREHEVEAIAVALLWAHTNPVHERMVQEILVAECPDLPILLSSQILPEIGEWVRTSATAMAAYIHPLSATYLRRLERWLTTSGLECGLLVMQVNGGCARVEQVLKNPLGLIASGPAAAPTAARQASRRLATGADPAVITIDMGGTSFDVCLSEGGAIPRSRRIMVDSQPLGIPGVEIHSIGAGGGSIGWVDSGGVLRVGPQSAGADPGPAAYGRGGTSPTVTDANVLLGYLSPDSLLGGRRLLDRGLAERAIAEKIAKALTIDVVDAANGMIRIVNENMANAVRAVSVARGIDPREFLVVAGGGAGPLHAGRLAAELGVSRVLVPREAGTLSSFGMTATDVRHDYAGTLYTTSSESRLDAVDRLLETLEARAIDELATSGFDRLGIELRRFVDARYVGQIHELMVPVGSGRLDAAGLRAVRDAFDAVHTERYTYALLDSPVEFLHWRVTGIGRIEHGLEASFGELPSLPADPARTGSRTAYFGELHGFTETPTYRGDELPAGSELVGPAIIDGSATTIVVYPGQHLVGDGRGNFLVTVGTHGNGPGGS